MTDSFIENRPSSSLASPDLGDNALEEARRYIGKEFRVERWNEQASKDVIRHYAWGLGDDNPLFTDASYGKRTRWGRMIAPPTFLFSVFDAVIGPGLPDVQWFYSGADWTFYRPVREGEEVLVRAILADAFEVSGKLVKRMIVQTGEVTYSTEDGEPLAKVLSHVFRVPRSGAEGGLRYERREPHRYSGPELSAIREAMLNEPVRGAKTRWWDDVSVGEELPPAVRGPLNQLDMTCYYAGSPGTSGYKSTKIKAKWSDWARNDPQRIPNNYDPSYYAPAVSPSIGHQDARIARDELGMPGPYDNGPQRIGFMACCVTNWIGDDGFVAALGARIKLPVIFGDTTFCKGKVLGKRLEAGKGLVDLELWAENQLGQVTATGAAVVELLRRT
jgi:acyl dehydratase